MHTFIDTRLTSFFRKMFTRLLNAYKKFCWKLLPSYPITTILENYSRYKNNVFFIQVGSSCGFWGDPIHPFVIKNHWAGIVVEPTTRQFTKLTNLYKSYKKIICVNAAISEMEGIRDFFAIKENKNNHEWYYQLGSFYRDIILRHKDIIPNIEELIVVEKVNSLSFESLLESQKISNIDLVHIDTEGYDYNIIKMINFSKTNPDIIIFENKFLSLHDYFECIRYLKFHGYYLYAEGPDTVAIKKQLNKLIVNRHLGIYKFL